MTSVDPYRYFRVEARELLEQLSGTILEIERTPSAALVARLLRLAHTLKGAARVVKQAEIANRAHALEDSMANGSSAEVARDRIDTVLALIDEMKARVSALDEPEQRTAGARKPTPADELSRAGGADRAEMDELLEGVTELHALLGPVRRSLGVVDRAQRLATLVVDQLSSPRTVESARSDDKTRSTAEELRALLAGIERSLSSSVDLVDRELAQVRRTSEQLRLMPASAMFSSLERATRDAAQTLDKTVIFESRGGEVRLDAPVLGAVQNALVQVVRNALAHGIEPWPERVAAGKPRAGRVTIEVVRRGRRVGFVASDDGRGVDLEAVRRAAKRRGLLSDAALALGAKELLNLLLAGGVSTAASVTEMSGRGVGLDVVRETAERFGGEVRVETAAGAGTTVELLVPMSLSSQEALLVEVSGTVATIPLDAVEQTIRIKTTDVARTTAGESLIHEGKVLPFLALGSALAAGRTVARPSAGWSAVVVRSAGGSAAVGVDRLLGTRTIVLRPLPRLAPAAAIVAGASLDADGDPQLVLDPDALVDAARQAPHTLAEERPVAPRRAPILVIDDSLTTRMLERSILESAGYVVDVAASAEEGLEKARRVPYSLFLVDIEMPGMDGFTFVERTRGDTALRSVPAILVSSRASPEDRRRGVEVGALDYMVKSEFDQVALLARIKEHVG